MSLKFSILVPLYNTPVNFLQEMIDSVQKQVYKNWELCLADASDEKHCYVGETVAEYVKKDSRIVYKKLKENGGISENTNACIELATGDYYALLDHDDVLDEKALKEVVRVIEERQADFIYTDEAKFTDSIENWFAPNYKPDFSKYELRAHNYICHLTVYKKSLLDQVGCYRKDCDGSQDHDMVLRLTEKAKVIVHIPKILYYWRVHSESVSSGVENKSYAIDAAKKAVLEQVKRSGQDGEVVTHTPFSLLYHVLYKIKNNPCVTIILHGNCDDLSVKNCVKSIENNAGYDNFEYLILSKDREKEAIEKILKKENDIHAYTVFENIQIEDDEKFNIVLMKHAYEFLLFLDVNNLVNSRNFIRELLMIAQQKDVAFVGPKIIDQRGLIKQAGIAFTRATDSGIFYRFKGELAESHGYEAALRHIRSTSALSKECMIIEKEKYISLGKFSNKWKWYKDIDLCFVAMQKGYENVWTPYAETVSSVAEVAPEKAETEKFIQHWKEYYLKEDPYYNKFIRYDVDHIYDKNTIPELIKKSVGYLKDEGLLGLKERVNVYRGKGRKHSSLHLSYSPLTHEQHVYKDVLFINGCAPMVPHPPRYRVTHQREQLEACNFTTDCVYYEDLNPKVVNDYRSFVFFRCPYTDQVGELINQAKALNRLVLFDIDDLVIDTKYTDTIPYVMSLNEDEKKVYDDGVKRMGKTLKLCDAAITTTERLAEELSNYVSEVFINRNTASERMYELSEMAIFERDILPNMKEEEVPANVYKSLYIRAKNKSEKRKQSGIHIGYFSGSITHNDDFEMIKPALMSVLKEFPNVKLHLVGELDLPKELLQFKKQIIAEEFTDWERLPRLIASVDINLAPITVSIFNEAKSENKWTEAALVKVPTIASNVGAFAVAIKHNETGLLCNTTEDWYNALKRLIMDSDERIRIAQNAYEFVKKEYITIYTGKRLANYIESKRKINTAFVLPSTEISGGIMVALKHASVLKKKGMDVFVIADSERTKDIMFEGQKFPVLSTKKTNFYGQIDKCVATMWSTVWFLQVYTQLKDRYYLIQNYETDFYRPGEPLRTRAEQTYHLNTNIKYLTISKWCERWLQEDYGKVARYVPNGIDRTRFYPVNRSFDGKIRILIEGDSSVYYKNVDESFRIVEKLDKSKYEIWYLSYNGKPKEWYYIDKFFNRVPFEKVSEIYRQCHILLKTSVLESFSYPPLEMMATGGYVVVVPNAGNIEYLRDMENCLMYSQGNIEEAVSKIHLIVDDKSLRLKLCENGKTIVQMRDWNNLNDDIYATYL